MSISSNRDGIQNSNIKITSEPFVSNIDISGNVLTFEMNNDGVISSGSSVLDGSKLDQYLSFNEESERIVSTNPIETSLNSLHLRNQHTISSGGENVFFINNTSNIRFFPCWQGLRDMRLEVNLGPEGIVQPSARKYTDYAFDIEQLGGPVSGSIIDFNDTTTYQLSLSVFAISFIMAEDIDNDICLDYSVEIDGEVIYTQQLKNVSIVKGQRYKFNFNHPLEAHAGVTATAYIKKIRVSTSEELGYLQVERAELINADGLIKPYVKIFLRTFEDKLIAFKDDLELLDVSGNFIQDLNTRVTDLESFDSSGFEVRLNYLENHHDVHPQDNLQEKIKVLEDEVEILKNNVTSLLNIFSSN